MKNPIIRTLVAGALVALVAGCTSTTGKTVGQNFDDATISAAVKTNLATDRARTLTAIDVDTVRGTVYLTGTVPNQAAKDRAAELANEVDGVERVVNNLQIRDRFAGDAPQDSDADSDSDLDDNNY